MSIKSDQRKYIKEKDQGFLGDGFDAAHHPFSCFKIDDELHIVYHIGEENQHVVTESVHKIYTHLDKYLWTPFAQFI